MWYCLGVHIVFGLPMWILMLTANCYTCCNWSWLCLNHINCDCVWIDWFVMSWLLIELFGPGAVLDWMGLRPWLVYWVLVLYKVSDRFSIDLMNLCLERDDHLYRVGNCFHGCGLGKTFQTFSLRKEKGFVLEYLRNLASLQKGIFWISNVNLWFLERLIRWAMITEL